MTPRPPWSGNSGSGGWPVVADATNAQIVELPGLALEVALVKPYKKRRLMAPARERRDILEIIDGGVMALRKVWMYNPHAGGVKIPPSTQEAVRKRITAYAEKNYAGKFTRIDVRFKGALCYLDAYTEPDVPKRLPSGFGETRQEYIERLRNTPTHLCRLRHFSADSWSVAFYTYSHERYEPCCFPNGEWCGTPEQAFEIGARYLQ